MQSVSILINGRDVPLTLTAAALFDLYKRHGVSDNLLQSTGALEDTPDGHRACARLVALLAEQAELRRRRLGHTPRAIPDEDEIFAGGSWDLLRYAASVAVRQGFSRSVQKNEPKTVNLVLAARAEHPDASAEALRIGLLTVCAVRLHLSPADALLLTPGEYLDMLDTLAPDRDEEQEVI